MNIINYCCLVSSWDIIYSFSYSQGHYYWRLYLVAPTINKSPPSSVILGDLLNHAHPLHIHLHSNPPSLLQSPARSPFLRFNFIYYFNVHSSPFLIKSPAHLSSLTISDLLYRSLTSLCLFLQSPCSHISPYAFRNTSFSKIIPFASIFYLTSTFCVI